MSRRHERAKPKPASEPAPNPAPWPPPGIRPHKTFLLVAAVLFFAWNAFLVWMWVRG